MQKFIKEIQKASINSSKGILEATEIAVTNKSSLSVGVISTSKVIASEQLKNFEKKSIINNNKLLRDSEHKDNSQKIKRSFDEKHNDQENLSFLTKEDDGYYTKDKIDQSKDDLFFDLTTLRNILKNENLVENSIALSKEIALFYTSDVSHNGENRGKVYNKKCEMYSDKFKENSEPFKNLSAEVLSSPINVSSKYEIKIMLHSKLTKSNCDSYKHAHEVVVAKKIAAETGNEIFVSGDCDENDPELLAWIGDTPLKKYDNDHNLGQPNKDIYQKVLTKKGTLKVVRGGDIKHRAAPKIITNKQLGENEKPYDMYISPGTLDEHSKTEVINTVSKNILSIKYAEYAELIQDKNASKSKIEELEQEIKAIQKYQVKQDLEALNAVSTVIKVCFNTRNIKLDVPETESFITPILYDEVD